MLIPRQSPPTHRNQRSKPFEGFGYALNDAKGLRISQNGNEDVEEENGDMGSGDTEFGGPEDFVLSM